MKKIFIILLIIAAVCLIAAGANILQKRKEAVNQAPVPMPVSHTVRIVMPTQKRVSPTITFLAKLEARNSASISSKLTGQITKLLVHESQKVRRGDSLVLIDDKEITTGLGSLQAQLTSAEDQLAFSNSEHERNAALFKVGGIAKEKLDGSEIIVGTALAKVKDLQQRFAGLENQLSYLNIKAPFDGVVGTVFQHRGDLAAPARAIITLNSLSQKLTFAFMPDSAVILVGMNVQVEGKKIGSITTIYNDAINGLAIAEVGIEKQINRPNGSYLTIKVRRKATTGCAVPVRALLHRKEGKAVMVYNNGHFTEEKVMVTASDQEFAVIEPCLKQPVAVAAEAKLALLPTYGAIKVLPMALPATIVHRGQP